MFILLNLWGGSGLQFQTVKFYNDWRFEFEN